MRPIKNVLRTRREAYCWEISVDERPAVQQLGWTDDMMLRAETPETPLQIQMLLIYDPSTAPGGKVTFKGILEELDARLHLADVFRRRLTELPGGLDRPYWVDDPSFDLEYHVRHIGLPQPGDWRQLCIQVARLHARQIDLRRPPWEITVIEGLNSVPGVPKGSFAMALKLHHCAVDGMASVQMIAAMHDLAADSPRPAAPDSPWRPGPLPTTANLLSRMAIKAALYPLRASTVLASSAPKAVRGLAGLPGKLVSGVVPDGRARHTVVSTQDAFQPNGLAAPSFRGPVPRARRIQADQGARARLDGQRCGARLRWRRPSPLSGRPRRTSR